MADPYQQAADKLKKETEASQQAQSANADKAWKNIHEGKTMPNENDMGPLPTIKKKYGGSIMEHKHHDDHVKQHEAGGHKHHSEHYGKHASGHKKHADHVKAMCKGGKAK